MDSNEIDERLAALREDVDATCGEIEKEATSLENQGRTARRWDMILRSTTAILAVIAPALVTYSTRPDVLPGFQLGAILLTGVAGAATTLLAIFGLRQSYVRSATTAISLRHVIRDLRTESDSKFKLEDKIEAIGMVRTILDGARRKAAELQLSVERARIEDYTNE